MNKKRLLSIVVIFIILIIILIIMLTQSNKEYFENKNQAKYEIGSSNIHGKGVICTQPIDKDEIIDIAIIRNINTNTIIITPHFGVYINHKRESNTKIVKEQDDEDDENEIYYIVATEIIKPNDEISCNYDGDDIPHFIMGSHESWNV